MYSFTVGHRLPASSLQCILMSIKRYCTNEREGAHGIDLEKESLI